MTATPSQSTPLKPGAAPTILVVFGATGDLMARKIAPALAYLDHAQVLPPQWQVVGVGRRALDDQAFRAHIASSIQTRLGTKSGSVTPKFLNRFTYHQGQFDDKALYQTLAARLGRQDEQWQTCANKLYYLAVPPELVPGIAERLHDAGLAEPCSDETGWTRVIVEKPFGRDLASSEQLDQLLNTLFEESQLYRIDHYLGKDVLQNILDFRFANRLFEPSWDTSAIERIDIHLMETIGVEDRGAFYDGLGTLRDVGQNHLLQMLALTTMDAPRSLAAADIRTARVALLRSVATPTKEDVHISSYRAQYTGYRSIAGVQPDSTTETYFKLKLSLKGERWAGVPVWLEAGKRLGSIDKAVIVTFRHPSPCLCPADHHVQNSVEFRLEPDPAIRVNFFAKAAGLDGALQPRTLTFSLADDPSRVQYVTEYAQLLLDCIRGDQTSFIATEELREMWRIVDPFVLGWANETVSPEPYQPDSDTVRQRATERLERTKGGTR